MQYHIAIHILSSNDAQVSGGQAGPAGSHDTALHMECVSDMHMLHCLLSWVTVQSTDANMCMAFIRSSLNSKQATSAHARTLSTYRARLSLGHCAFLGVDWLYVFRTGAD